MRWENVMTRVEQELLTLEKRFWTGDRAFYEQNVDEHCLVAFNREMAGVMSNKEIAATVKSANRWRNLEVELRGLVAPSDDTAILSYEAQATRDNGERYAALVSSGYAKRGGRWKLVFHQQMHLN
jgi:hypothetical protein